MGSWEKKNSERERKEKSRRLKCIQLLPLKKLSAERLVVNEVT